MNHLPGNNWSDKQLVTAILNGNTAAFATIIKNTEGLVAQIVFQMVINAEDRKDIAQDIYLKAFKNLPGFRFQSKLSTWIGQVAYHTCLNYLDKKKLVLDDSIINKMFHDDDDSALATGNASGNFTSHAEDLIFKKELDGILQQAISQLPALYKTLITLFHHEELSYEEIGQITGLPAGTLKSYLFRARKTLRDTLLMTYKKEELL